MPERIKKFCFQGSQHKPLLCRKRRGVAVLSRPCRTRGILFPPAAEAPPEHPWRLTTLFVPAVPVAVKVKKGRNVRPCRRHTPMRGRAGAKPWSMFSPNRFAFQTIRPDVSLKTQFFRFLRAGRRCAARVPPFSKAEYSSERPPPARRRRPAAARRPRPSRSRT